MYTKENDLQTILDDLSIHLEEGIIPFWLRRSIDREYGGFLTCFDQDGKPTGDVDKYLITQTRMIWGLSRFGHYYPEKTILLEEAKKGVCFLIDHFWDRQFGGWCWKSKRDGTILDNGKLVYGQVFAIYALSEYTLATRDMIGLEYADETFNLLQKYCVDTYYGGYYENLEADWKVSPSGSSGGDRKSLDIHMHVMEAFTTLAKCSNQEIHRRKLEEVINLILKKMIHQNYGCGLNQFDLGFNPIPPIAIKRTWNAERQKGQILSSPIDTTSYGHNLEFAWLLNETAEVLGRPKDYYKEVIKKLVNHSFEYGFDTEYGGVYRDGPYNGPSIVTDKEFWQNAEALVGFLEAYEIIGDKRYLEAFQKCWDFVKCYMINHAYGEWRQLVDRQGSILVGNLGNPWKACYHTGRSVLESMIRIKRILGY